MRYQALGIPDGVVLDKTTGILPDKIANKGKLCVNLCHQCIRQHLHKIGRKVGMNWR